MIPTKDTTYRLTATGDGGVVSQPVTIQLNLPIIQSFTSNMSPDQYITHGQPATLQWNVLHAATVSIDPGGGLVKAQGSVQFFPMKTTDYTLTCTGVGDPVRSTLTVNVWNPWE
ncbi:hypothetical protein SPSIL_041250 [Sporomusa silvacetica DSM 10669]|uniref:Uncharacterized protein n=1 Tax=Sporomusa silvacetica DSM 10669 TaxID=1123289 RepID=A0ABZ3IQT3_9FIRM|nr:hypothetical protein [Sporomusa silvacetica]OZC20387.1 hypothetical protein SPSIL_12540 [Sporomusa silvacetica DSM 10669]